MTEHQLFITGCPGSGMAQVALLLNEHPEVVLGVERYARVAGLLDPFLIEPEWLVAAVAAETGVRAELLYRRLAERVARGAVKCAGDASALYVGILPELLTRFPHVRIVVVVREPEAVAAELEWRSRDASDVWPANAGAAAVPALWNDALARTRDTTRKRPGARILLLPYEPFIDGDQEWFQRLVAFARLPMTARLEAEYDRLVSRRNERPAPDPATIERDPELDRWRAARTARPPGRIAVPEPVPALDEPPLTDDEIEGRRHEREQLCSEIRHGSSPSDGELELLSRRYEAQTRELVRRAARLRAARRAAVDGLPAPELRVSLICPHQRPTTGGVYAIEQLAIHLAPIVRVRLIVRKPPVRRLAGVDDVRVSPGLSGVGEDADVIVYPADMQNAPELLKLVPEGVRSIALLQGFGTPGNPTVSANLEAAREVVATSAWLGEAAREHGAPSVYLPYGLDRSVFRPGRPASERGLTMTALTHYVDWKGGDDLRAVTERVRQARPDVQVTLYGGAPVDGAGTFLLRPDRRRVAELLATSAVHVVSSWEEGFGLPGAEALACGAALASTDTKGSRDYAIHGRTALVSPPRDPEALAQNVLALLDEPALRDRLAGEGGRHVRALLPPWREVGRRFALLLGEGA